MAGTLKCPEVVFHDEWNYWSVDAGYYGRPDGGVTWCVEQISPNTEQEAEVLLAFAEKITAALAGRKSGLPPLAGAISGVRYRLRAEKTSAGWRVSEYDFKLWFFDIASNNNRPPNKPGDGTERASF